ncbi:hypothetical protein PROFUN_16495 [Planoprotostelium fungivorum]|uniref:Uncharacterized protein n=1 Tax=Planoprotostelium fungivorum TaxID=1890364 RepID=A0A2P6MQA3_9EUKA|nr:hypothetical protein PROFUN_16495 [Planoprotostelium fungivorum]
MHNLPSLSSVKETGVPSSIAHQCHPQADRPYCELYLTYTYTWIRCYVIDHGIEHLQPYSPRFKT